ncbi:MAG: hypothetical protein R3F19_29760 [Verrucomicrobiales bacterium]
MDCAHRGAFEGARLDNISIAPGGPTVPLGLRFVSVSRDAAAQAVTVVWASEPGKTYLIEAGTDFENWDELQDGYESGGAETSFTEQGIPAETTERYYRVREE